MFFFDYSSIDQDIAKIDKAIQEKTDRDKKINYEKYISMYMITKDFIKKNKLLVYGGLALNVCLPKHKRLYDEYELPDYDFFSYDAKKHAKDLADLYHKMGYPFVEVKPGIHDSTYKVFVDFQTVADITEIPKHLFDKLMVMSKEERPSILKQNPNLDISVVPLSLLRWSFHVELSRPNGYIERWPKVYKRMVLFYSYYPLMYEQCSGVFKRDNNARIHDLVRIVVNYCNTHRLPMSGLEALKIYMKHHGTPVLEMEILDEKMALVEIISTDYEDTSKTLLKLLKTMVEGTEKVTMKHHAPLNKSEMIPKHSIIYFNNRPLVVIYNSTSCYAYKHVDGTNILSIDSMLSFMYAYLFTTRSYLVLDKIKCAINILLNLQAKHINSLKPIWKRFDLQCYGHQPTMDDVKRKKWQDKKQIMIYRPNSNQLSQKKSKN